MNLTPMLSWVTTYSAPIVTLLVGMLILGFVGYINWHGNTKADVVRWIAKKIYRDSVGSETLADGLFMTITSLLLAIGGIIVVVSLLFF